MFLDPVCPNIPQHAPSPLHIISFYLITDWVQLVSPADLIHTGNGGCSEITRATGKSHAEDSLLQPYSQISSSYGLSVPSSTTFSEPWGVGVDIRAPLGLGTPSHSFSAL